MTLPSGGAACDDDEIKFGEASDAATAPQKWIGGKAPPWTAEEDAILRRIRKQYDAGGYASHAAFAQAASDALGGKRTPIACQRRYIKLRPEPQPGIARPKRIKLDANAAIDCDDADGDEGGAAAVLHKSKALSWSPDEDSVLRQLVDRWHVHQFASARSFYDEAVKQLAGRSASAIRNRLRFLELTVPSDDTRDERPLWSQSENDILIDICCQCNEGQFGSGETLLAHFAERLPGRSTGACYIQLRKLGHDIPQLLRQIYNAAIYAAKAAAKGGKHGAAVALKIKPPSVHWSPEEDSALKHLMSQWRKKHFPSTQDFYDEAVKRLPGRSANAMATRLRDHHKITNVPSTWYYKPAVRPTARGLSPAHGAATADVAAVVKDDISDDAPLPAQPQATLPPPPLWMIRNSASGKTWGPFLISVLRRGVAEGRISAKGMLAWRQDEGESAAISLRQRWTFRASRRAASRQSACAQSRLAHCNSKQQPLAMCTFASFANSIVCCACVTQCVNRHSSSLQFAPETMAPSSGSRTPRPLVVAVRRLKHASRRSPYLTATLPCCFLGGLPLRSAAVCQTPPGCRRTCRLRGRWLRLASRELGAAGPRAGGDHSLAARAQRRAGVPPSVSAVCRSHSPVARLRGGRARC